MIEKNLVVVVVVMFKFSREKWVQQVLCLFW
jgi:hypothetical protein